MPLIRKGPLDTAPAVEVDLQSLIGALHAGDPDERWRAARGLGSQPVAVSVLDQALATEADARVREAIFTSLARIGTPEAADAVIVHVRSDDANMRTDALDALRAMMSVVEPRLPALLVDEDTDVRILCCDLVRELPSAEATRLLGAVLTTDPQPNVCAAAIDVLAEVGDLAAIPYLQQCASRFEGQGFVAFAAKIACERIAAERAEPNG